jgi:transcriptional regulator GlxA family with amidase domain
MRIVFPLYDRFTALDAVGPYEILSRLPGAEVVFAAVERGPVRTDTGALALTADAALSEIGHADIVVVPGGPGTEAAIFDETYVGWLRQIHSGTRWTTSVCSGALLLGAAGLLDGPATTHWYVKDFLPTFGSAYTPERVVIGDRIVTAAGVSAGIDMALTLTARIAGEEFAQAVQLFIEYDPQPPFDTGAPAKASKAIMDQAVELLKA